MPLKIFLNMLVFLKSGKRDRRRERNSSDCFSVKLVTIEGICKEILTLDASKDTQRSEMPAKIIKNNFDIFSKFFEANFNIAIKTRFQKSFSLKNVTEMTRKTIDQSVFFPMYLNFLKGVSTSK